MNESPDPTAQPPLAAPAPSSPPGAPPETAGWAGFEAPKPAEKNGFAIASLIFGIIGGIPLGLVFGFLGLNRAKKLGGLGKGMAWAGIVLSVLWIAPAAYLVPHMVKASDPGCIAAKDTIGTYSDARLSADSSNPDALKSDFQAIVDQLNAAAAKSNSSSARSAISAMASDFQELLNAINTGTQPSADLESRAEAHGQAIDSACGTIGS